MLLALLWCCALSQGPAVVLTTVKLADDLFLITGSAAGNVLVATGTDATLLVDAQDPRHLDQARELVERVARSKIRFVVNTHFHEDHRGLNQVLAERGAVIVAHERTRRSMAISSDVPALEWHRQAAPHGAWPTLTFTSGLTLHVNDEVVEVIHLPAAHTDGDAVVRLRHHDVIHTGDIYEIGAYPFIDVWSGGSIDGMIAAVDRLLEWCGASTRLVPGHGPVSSKPELQAYRDMLVTIRDRVQHAIDEGRTLDELLVTRPTQEFDRARGGAAGGARLVRILYQELSER